MLSNPSNPLSIASSVTHPTENCNDVELSWRVFKTDKPEMDRNLPSHVIMIPLLQVSQKTNRHLAQMEHQYCPPYASLLKQQCHGNSKGWRLLGKVASMTNMHARITLRTVPSVLSLLPNRKQPRSPAPLKGKQHSVRACTLAIRSVIISLIWHTHLSMSNSPLD